MTDIAFIITGMGRSGTMWLAKLLNKAAGVSVFHEPLRHFVPHIEKHYFDYDAAVLNLHRRKLGMVAPDGNRWGEVNSYLRYWVEPMREVFPDVPILGLVRDGKKTVGSLIRRGVYGRRDRRVLPKPPLIAATQFAMCCWYWADTYERLLKQEVTIFTLEELNESYGACEALCDGLGIEIPERTWKRYAGHPMHTDRGSLNPLHWSSAQEETFKKWAGDTYREVGYEAG